MTYVDRVDNWVVEATHVGILNHMRVRHDNAGDKESWFIENIDVEDMKTSTKYWFDCRDWLALHQGDGVIERILVAEGTHRLDHTLFRYIQ